MKEKLADKSKCPMCENDGWEIAKKLAFAATMTGGQGIALDTGYPLAVVFCKRCAFVRFHNAMAIPGLLPPQPQEPVSPTSKSEEVKHG